MKLDGLSLEQAPPISVPLRFFIAAPLMGVFSLCLLLALGPDSLSSRWAPGMLALTHGIVLGMFATVMFGALLQMLPVLAGAVVQAPRLLANLLLPLWVLGVLALQAAFLHATPFLYWLAALMLSLAVMLFVSFCGMALLRATSQIASVAGMRLALFALAVTLVLGVLLALGHAGVVPLWRPLGTDVHAMWGLLGWIGLLVIAVSWQVVPMFQITASFPKQTMHWMPRLFLLFFVLKSLLFWPAPELGLPSSGLAFLKIALELGLSLLLLLFAIQTLRLQQSRKRKVSDSHVHFWRLGCGLLLLSVVCWWLGRALGMEPLGQKVSLFAPILFVGGFVMAIMTGMLYKIVAFLVWFHLQGLNTQRMLAGKSLIQVPHMKAVIAEVHIKWQLRVFLLAVCTLPVMLIWPASYALALVWLVHFGLLFYQMQKAAWHYRRLAHPD